jgi:cation diffusion facilitator CzcD-associated flavoprotein CzcO
MKTECDVAIVGAGPYGLSLAAHLNDRRVDFQLFGEPMQFWRNHMPRGMKLKSDGFASNLYDPNHSYTLRQYCQEQGLNYKDTRLPVDLDTFVKYGIAFKTRFVPQLRSNYVLNIDAAPHGFSLRLDNDDIISARSVVVAAGILDFRHIPSALKALPSHFVTHSSEHHELSSFRNREVVVLGAGASATDIAALLQDDGARVQLVSRAQLVKFHSVGDADRSILQKIRHPSSGIGPGLRTRFYCDAPGLFHFFPEQLRLEIVRRTLGPAGGWFMKDKVVGRIPLLVGSAVEDSNVMQDRVQLKIRGADGALRELEADHVIAATGYKLDLQRFDFLATEIRSRLKAVDGTPILSSSMESSIPGLYFMGAIAANSFGPVMRFAFGARFAAARIDRALA